MRFKFSCMSCGESLETVDISSPYTEFGETAFDITVELCTCADAKPEIPETDPIRLPYSVLACILKDKIVTVVYRKKNGSIRELIGYLGTNDLRHVDSNLHYFHELDDSAFDSYIGEPRLKTSVKCLMANRIISVSHDMNIIGNQKVYEVLEAY